MEPVLPQTPMRGWSILTTIENSFSRNGPSVGDTEAIYAGCLGQEGDPCSVKTPEQHLFRVITLWGNIRAFRVQCPFRVIRVGLAGPRRLSR
jgi:hypothetical protein